MNAYVICSSGWRDFYCNRMLFSFLYRTQSISVRLGLTRTIEMKRLFGLLGVEKYKYSQFPELLLFIFGSNFAQALEPFTVHKVQ